MHLVDHDEVGIEVRDGAEDDVGHRLGADLPALGERVQVDRLDHESGLGVPEHVRPSLGRHLPA